MSLVLSRLSGHRLLIRVGTAWMDWSFCYKEVTRTSTTFLAIVPRITTRHLFLSRHHHHRSHFSSSSSSDNGSRNNANGGEISHSDPYQILGVPQKTPLDQVKRAFLTAAHRYHPDKEGGSTEAFLKVQQAFEQIVLDENFNSGGGPADGWQNNKFRQSGKESFQNWMRRQSMESNHNNQDDIVTFDMDERTRKEVIEAYRTIGPPTGRDKGGYWEMARQLSERDALASSTSQSSSSHARLGVGSTSAALSHRRKRNR